MGRWVGGSVGRSVGRSVSGSVGGSVGRSPTGSPSSLLNSKTTAKVSMPSKVRADRSTSRATRYSSNVLASSFAGVRIYSADCTPHVWEAEKNREYSISCEAHTERHNEWRSGERQDGNQRQRQAFAHETRLTTQAFQTQITLNRWVLRSFKK